MVYLCKHKTSTGVHQLSMKEKQIPGHWKAFSQCNRGDGGGSWKINCQRQVVGATLLLLAVHILLHFHSHLQLKNSRVSVPGKEVLPSGARFTQITQPLPVEKSSRCVWKWWALPRRLSELEDPLERPKTHYLAPEVPWEPDSSYPRSTPWLYSLLPSLLS